MLGFPGSWLSFIISIIFSKLALENHQVSWESMANFSALALLCFAISRPTTLGSASAARVAAAKLRLLGTPVLTTCDFTPESWEVLDASHLEPSGV